MPKTNPHLDELTESLTNALVTASPENREDLRDTLMEYEELFKGHSRRSEAFQRVLNAIKEGVSD